MLIPNWMAGIACLSLSLALIACASASRTEPPPIYWTANSIEEAPSIRACQDRFRPDQAPRREVAGDQSKVGFQVVQTGNFGDIEALAMFSGDDYLATGDSVGGIVIWNRKTGEHLRTIMDAAGVSAMVSVPGHPILVTSSDECTVSLWDIRTGALLGRTDQITGSVRHLVVLGHEAKTTIVAGATNTDVLVWKFEAGAGRQVLRHPRELVEGMAAAPDKKRLAITGAEGALEVIDLEAKTWMAVPLTSGSVRSEPEFADDSHIRMINGAGQLTLIDLNSRTHIDSCRTGVGIEFRHQIGTVSEGVWRLRRSGNRLLAAAIGPRDGKLSQVIWDVTDCRRVFDGALSKWGDKHWSPTAFAAAAGGSEIYYPDRREIVRLDTQTGRELGRHRGDAQPADFMVATPKGTAFAVESESRVLFVDLANGSTYARPHLRKEVKGALPSGTLAKTVAIKSTPEGKSLLLTASSEFTPGKEWPHPIGRSSIQIAEFDHEGRSERLVCPSITEAGELTGFLASTDGTTAVFFLTQSAGERAYTHHFRLMDLTNCRPTLSIIDETDKSFGYIGATSTAALSNDGRWLATGHYGDKNPSLRVLRSDDGKACDSASRIDLQGRFSPDPPNVINPSLRGVRSLAFSEDGRYLVSGHDNGDVNVYDLTALSRGSCAVPAQLTAKWSFSGERWPAAAVALHSASMTVAIGTDSGRVRLVSLQGEATVDARFNAPIRGVAILDERYVVVAPADGAVHIVDRRSSALPAERLLSVVATRDDAWVAMTPEGRFDTNSVEGLSGFRWVMSDDPMRALPLEMFTREYYEPRLVERVRVCRDEQVAAEGACEKEFAPVRAVADLNRLQPEIRDIVVTEHASMPGVARVSVTVSSGRKDAMPVGATWRSAAFDLRLFRNGQLVGQYPKAAPQGLHRRGDQTQELDAWMASAKVTDEDDSKEIVFDRVGLPTSDKVEFSAYAFNADRIKGPTRAVTFPRAASSLPAQPTAYVVAIGVSAFSDSTWDLRYADNDARRMTETLVPYLEKSGGFTNVVPVTLQSSWQTVGEGKGMNRVVTSKTATKENIRRVFDLLSGRGTELPVGVDLSKTHGLRPAKPDDLVVISISSHGYVDDAGNFFVFPFDVSPKAAINKETLDRSISSAELASWVQDVDAADVVLVIDACHSAAGVSVPGFKPGPMGSRGLGQLAYDKGMRVLASTRADDLAWEADQKQQGLMSYALVREGLELGGADFRPHDGVIGLGEWLAYATRRVPELYLEGEEIARKGGIPVLIRFDARSRRPRPVDVGGKPVQPGEQRPQLFDFRRGADLPIVRELNLRQ